MPINAPPQKVEIAASNIQREVAGAIRLFPNRLKRKGKKFKNQIFQKYRARRKKLNKISRRSRRTNKIKNGH